MTRKTLAIILGAVGIVIAGALIYKFTGNNQIEETVQETPAPAWHAADGYIKESEPIGEPGSASDTSSESDQTTTEASTAKDTSDQTTIEASTTEEASEPATNTEYSLSVPTYIGQVGGDYFIADCYHNQIIYNDNLTDDLLSWKTLATDLSQPHTMAGDGQVIVIDDTEKNEVRVYEPSENGYKYTQLFTGIGNRPHYTVYDETEKAFYTWSSMSGEMYIFRHEEGDTKMYLTEIRTIEALSGTYIRSFYIDGNDIYFVSGIRGDGTSSGILKCDKKTFEIKETYSVPDSIAGMAAMRFDAPYFYITVSTDVAGSQDAATMIRTKDLKGLAAGDYEDIYAAYFMGGGTPYNMFKIGDKWFLTEHRIPGHAIWSYKIDENGEITDVETVY